MTEPGSAASPSIPPPAPLLPPSHPVVADSSPETSWDVTYRRARYACAIAVSVLLFWIVGWKLAAPPADWGGVSLLAWGDSGLVASVGLTLLLLGATTLCSLLVHPDSPHMGLFCALIGLAGLSIRGGPAHRGQS